MQDRIASEGGDGVIKLCPNRFQRVSSASLSRFPARAGRTDRALRDRLMTLVDCLTTIEDRHHACDFAGLGLSSATIAEVAGELGFPDLRRAALNAGECLCSTDAAAIAATLARVVRLGRSSLDHMSALRHGDR